MSTSIIQTPPFNPASVSQSRRLGKISAKKQLFQTEHTPKDTQHQDRNAQNKSRKREVPKKNSAVPHCQYRTAMTRNAPTRQKEAILRAVLKKLKKRSSHLDN